MVIIPGFKDLLSARLPLYLININTSGDPDRYCLLS